MYICLAFFLQRYYLFIFYFCLSEWFVWWFFFSLFSSSSCSLLKTYKIRLYYVGFANLKRDATLLWVLAPDARVRWPHRLVPVAPCSVVPNQENDGLRNHEKQCTLGKIWRRAPLSSRSSSATLLAIADRGWLIVFATQWLPGFKKTSDL